MTTEPTHGQGHAAIALARTAYGFVCRQKLATIAGDEATRLTLLLVRTGSGRFLAPAQNVQHFMDIIEADGRDYVRDVSLPAKD